MAVALVALGFGLIPGAAGSGAGRAAASDEARFPCENAPCGCGSPERCWQTCCCNTPELRLAWCLAEEVVPPSYAVLPPGWTPRRIRSTIAVEVRSRSGSRTLRTALAEPSVHGLAAKIWTDESEGEGDGCGEEPARPACCASRVAEEAIDPRPPCCTPAPEAGCVGAEPSCCAVDSNSECSTMTRVGSRATADDSVVQPSSGAVVVVDGVPLDRDGGEAVAKIGVPVGGTREKCRGGAGDGTGLGIVPVLPPPAED